MILARCNFGLALFSLALLTACGSPGEPVPPSLELARPVNDLRAARKGNAVTLTWTMSTRTTDGHNIRHAGPTTICRATNSMKQCDVPVTKLAPPKTHDTAKSASSQSYTDALSSASSDAASKVVYAVEVLNIYGRSAGLSNQVAVPAVPALSAPSDLRAQMNSEGVRLTWTPLSDVPHTAGLRFVYRIYRRESGANAQIIAGEVPVDAATQPTFLDSSIEWEKTYVYHAAVVTLITEPKGREQQVEGDDTTEVTIAAHDVFPPAVPDELEAVSSGPGQKPFVDLVWTPDTDADLAGYNVYRTEAGTEPKKLNSDPVNSPAFRDEGVSPGHKYTYSVSAVDARGNESAHSQSAEEKVSER